MLRSVACGWGQGLALSCHTPVFSFPLVYRNISLCSHPWHKWERNLCDFPLKGVCVGERVFFVETKTPGVLTNRSLCSWTHFNTFLVSRFTSTSVHRLKPKVTWATATDIILNQPYMSPGLSGSFRELIFCSKPRVTHRGLWLSQWLWLSGTHGSCY